MPSASCKMNLNWVMEGGTAAVDGDYELEEFTNIQNWSKLIHTVITPIQLGRTQTVSMRGA